MTNMDWCGTGQLVEEMRKEKEDLKDLVMPEGEWRPKADDPSVMEWWGTSELLREMEEQGREGTRL